MASPHVQVNDNSRKVCFCYPAGEYALNVSFFAGSIVHSLPQQQSWNSWKAFESREHRSFCHCCKTLFSSLWFYSLIICTVPGRTCLQCSFQRIWQKNSESDFGLLQNEKCCVFATASCCWSWIPFCICFYFLTKPSLTPLQTSTFRKHAGFIEEVKQMIISDIKPCVGKRELDESEVDEPPYKQRKYI